jgi:hypothetical protein
MKWRTASNGAGKLHWFLMHEDTSRSFSERYLWTANDQLVRFASHAAAQKRADKLNAEPEAQGGPA